MTNDEDLELLNRSDNTAFCLAVAAGNIEMVKIMMTRHSSLHDIAGADGMMPVYVSVVHERHDTAKYLYNASRRLTGYFWTPRNWGSLLLKCVEDDFFECPKVKLKIYSKGLVMKRAGKYSSRILFLAAEIGNAKFVIEFLRAYPDLIWKTNDDTYSIFHVAVMNRCHDIHNLLYKIGTYSEGSDNSTP
ncbi:hypothetical protein L6452_14287 [Arctium lappa]|uniref:Uncharacterized protein n=1 Tax=Arctium lappa TaxID=4217 RepID=A0ACB9CKW3_ARCLA|nr:hypothetical protein L6452_14287 [Arctium lappa]